MTYFDNVINAYRDTMMENGVSEDTVNFALFAFESGFMAGTLHKNDVELQQQMVAAILNKIN